MGGTVVIHLLHIVHLCAYVVNNQMHGALVFDTLSWPSSIISNGPPPIRTYVPSLSTLSREGWRDATEESHGGAVRGDSTRIRVWCGHDSRGGPHVRRASPPGAR